MTTEEEIEHAIRVLEQNRAVLGDHVVDIAIHSLQLEANLLFTQKTALKHQRKLMTIIFVDVVDSTKLFGSLDPEDNLTIMDNSLQRLSEPIVAFGGRVTRFMGDGFLAVFGLPKTKENDPELAVKSGLEVLKTAETIASEVEDRWKIKGFQVRIGINTGLVVTGGYTEAEDTLMGGTVNLAARLETSAEPGELLISHNTYQHVRGLFEFKSVKQIIVKGFKEKVQAYSVSKVKIQSFHQDNRGIIGVDIPLIGMDNELKTLQRAVDSLNKDKSSKLVLVEGDIGIGKTRLLYEFESWLNSTDHKFITLRARATLENSENPYVMVRKLFLPLFNVEDDDIAETVYSKILDAFKKELFEKLNEENIAAVITQFLGYSLINNKYISELLVSPQLIRDLGTKYIIEYLKGRSTEIPFLIMLDNLQWADESSMKSLLFMRQEMIEAKIMIVAAYRPNAFGNNELLNQSDVKINLRPLGEIESRTLLATALSKIQNPPDEIMSLILEHMDGNPFIMEEIINMLTANGVIFKGGERWKIKLELLDEFQIPDTLAGIIQARLDTISGNERNILEIASMIGLEFWDNAIKSIAFEILNIQENEVNVILETLVFMSFITKNMESTYQNSQEFSFNHSMLKDVVYERVLKHKRQEYHKLMAKWLIDNNSFRSTEIPGIIASHYEKAGDKTNASDYYITAAENATSRYALKEANGFYSKALTLMNKDDISKQFHTMLAYEKILRILRDTEIQEEIIEQLQTLSEKARNDEWKLKVLIIKAWNDYWSGRYDTMFERVKETIEKLKMVTSEELLQEGYYLVAWSYHMRNEYENASQYANLALKSVKKLGNLRQEGTIFNVMGMIHISSGDFSAAINYITKFLKIARQINDYEREITALNNLSTCYIRLGRFDEALKVIDEAYSIEHKTGTKIGTALIHINLAWVLASKQLWKEGLNQSLQVIEISKKLKNDEFLAESYMWLGHCQFGLAKYDLAYESYRQALQLREKLSQNSLAMGAIAGMARVALAKNQTEIASNHVDTILEYLEKGGDLKGTWEPHRIMWTCVIVLDRLKDHRLNEVLTKSVGELQIEVDKIRKSEDKEAFLLIPWHKQLHEFYLKTEK